MAFLILGLLLGSIVGFFTATLLVCAARSERDDAVEPVASAGSLASRDTRDRRRAAAAARG